MYCQWVQLYELSPENVKIIYRTFASQFRHVVVFSAEDLSSDTILVGSDAPLPLDLAHLRRGFAAPGVARGARARVRALAVRRAGAHAARGQARGACSYTQLEERLEGGALRSACRRRPTPRRALRPDCRRTPAPLNTDDNALIEFARRAT